MTLLYIGGRDDLMATNTIFIKYELYGFSDLIGTIN